MSSMHYRNNTHYHRLGQVPPHLCRRQGRRCHHHSSNSRSSSSSHLYCGNSNFVHYKKVPYTSPQRANLYLLPHLPHQWSRRRERTKHTPFLWRVNIKRHVKRPSLVELKITSGLRYEPTFLTSTQPPLASLNVQKFYKITSNSFVT